MNKRGFARRVRWIVGVCWVLSAPAGHALMLFNVSLDTSPLQGHPAGPFYLDFQLNDGSGTGDANNTATLSNFQFGAGGSAAGSANLSGGASGDLASTVTLTDSDFFNEFFQQFTPGDSLSFDMMLTTNVDSPIPDQFSFAILDNTLAEIPTKSLLNVFLLVDIDSANPLIQMFGSDPDRTPEGGGEGISMDAPQIGEVGGPAPVPEPGSLVVLAMGLVGVGTLLRRQR